MIDFLNNTKIGLKGMSQKEQNAFLVEIQNFILEDQTKVERDLRIAYEKSKGQREHCEQIIQRNVEVAA